MEIRFQNLRFSVTEDQTVVFAGGMGCKNETNPMSFTEIRCAGDVHRSSLSSFRRVGNPESSAQKYVSHRLGENALTVVTASDRLQVETVLEATEGTNAIRCFHRVTNLGEEEVILEAVNSALLAGFTEQNPDDCKDLYLHRYRCAHHWESQPEIASFFDLGIRRDSSSIRQSNMGSWSTKDFMPQGIIEDRRTGKFLMFQIESNYDWYYEIAYRKGQFYLNLAGTDCNYHQWCKKLQKGESFTSLAATVVHGTSLNGVLGEMTRYRRSRKPHCKTDEGLPIIFNEYMHLSWDDPNEERTRRLAPIMKDLGAQYYVIDCGWHDEVPTQLIYPNVGVWKESQLRYPGGLKNVADYVHSLGLKFGLWIEPEIVGWQCEEMLRHYPKECFFHRNGKKCGELGRLFLDYRHPAVRETMSEVIRRMVEDYGADYIKFDYNEDCGPGTEIHADSLGDGLAGHAEAFLSWVDEIQMRHPHVIFENCGSGGMRMDALTLSHFPLTSTSDQIYYYYYPYVVAGILTSCIPEQAAVWNYPMNRQAMKACPEDPESLVSEEVVVINMINSLLGRIHLASRIQLLSENKQALVKEGLSYYHSMTETKLNSVPYLPMGYSQKGDGTVAVGIMDEKKLYLAVWNLHGKKDVTIPLPELFPKSVKVGYPQSLFTDYSWDKDGIHLHFTEDEQARLFEIEL